MNEAELKKMVDTFKSFILADNGKEADRFLLLLAKEVEREVRHKATDMAHELAQQIDALHD